MEMTNGPHDAVSMRESSEDWTIRPFLNTSGRDRAFDMRLTLRGGHDRARHGSSANVVAREPCLGVARSMEEIGRVGAGRPVVVENFVWIVRWGQTGVKPQRPKARASDWVGEPYDPASAAARRRGLATGAR